MTQPSSSSSTPTEEPWTVRRVLEWTTGHLKKHGSDTPRLDAEILLAHARGCPRIQLYTQFDEPLTDAVRSIMRDLVKRRANAEPVAYLVGQREFFSLSFRVTPEVLIPRPDTETLVLEILDETKSRPSSNMLDLCTGSGCVAIAVAKNSSAVSITAVDISPAAIAIARENAERHRVSDRVNLIESDLFSAIPAGTKFDVIGSNPPYIASAEIKSLDSEVARHEPQLALDGGADGMDYLRKIITEAPGFATPGGLLLLEFASEQAESLVKFAEAHGGYEQVAVRDDLGKRPRVLKARFRA